jgi:microcystin-dependent protein
VAVTNNQAVSSVTNTVTNNQAVSVTGSISNTALTTAQLSSHLHTTNAPSPAAGGQVGGGGPAASGSANIGNTGSGTGHNHAHTLAGTLTGTVAVTSTGAALSGTVTAAGNNAFSPYVVVNYIIKH